MINRNHYHQKETTSFVADLIVVSESYTRFLNEAWNWLSQYEDVLQRLIVFCHDTIRTPYIGLRGQHRLL